jgi:hypothetical protein
MLAVTHAGPGATSYTGVRDYLRLSIGDFPTTGEFAADGSAVIGALQGVVGAVVQPSNVSSTVTAFFGVAGYSGCNTGVGLAGSCTGVAGNAVALADASSGSYSFLAGLNAVVSNAPKVTNAATQTGHDYVNMSAVELDTNLMKLSGGTAPHSNVTSILIAGASETAPLTGSTDCGGNPCIFDAIYIQPPSLTGAIVWNNAIEFAPGAAVNAMKIGAVCQATGQCSSQAIKFDAYTAAGAGNLVEGTISMSGGSSGNLIVNGPAQVALQVAGVNLLNVTSGGIAFSQPLTGGTHYGGSATNSQVAIRSTSNGSPSGDAVSILGSTTNIGSANGLTAFASFTSSNITLASVPGSAGAGGVYVCIDTAGLIYKKASCP